MTPKRRKQKPATTYQTCLITYIDILGFKALIRKNKCKQIVDILDSFRVTNQVASKLMVRKKRLRKVKLHFFSDCIVRVIPLRGLTDNEIMLNLENEIFQLALIQTYLIEQGTFIRGCMNIGKLYNQRDMFFGKAFNDAYRYESQRAVNPVIIISDELINVVAKQPMPHYLEIYSWLHNMEMSFNHSYSYINYIYLMVSSRLDMNKREVCKFMKVHKAKIEEELNKNKEDVNVLMKYLWLKEYHNHFVTWLPDDVNQSDLLIGDNVSELTPVVKP